MSKLTDMEKQGAEEQGASNLSSQSSEGSLNGSGMVVSVAGCGLAYQATATSAPLSYGWNDSVIYTETCVYS